MADRRRFVEWLSPLYQRDWVVHVEAPQDRPAEQALKYVARYTYRVAISNQRIAALEGEGSQGQATFWYKDNARGGKWKTMKLCGVEFLRRYMQHVLPRGLVRIRFFGFLALGHRTAKLALIRRLLACEALACHESPPAEPNEEFVCRCPHCGEPALRLIDETARPSVRRLVAATYQPPPDQP